MGSTKTRKTLAQGLTCLEICAGGGGAAIGPEQAGFSPVALLDNDPHSCETLRHNRPYRNVVEVDIQRFDASYWRGVDLLSGGFHVHLSQSRVSNLAGCRIRPIPGNGSSPPFPIGCFWHRYVGCQDGRIPQSNTSYWWPKLMRNKERDVDHLTRLTTAGWKVLVVWECETVDHEDLSSQLQKFLE